MKGMKKLYSEVFVAVVLELDREVVRDDVHELGGVGGHVGHVVAERGSRGGLGLVLSTVELEDVVVERCCEVLSMSSRSRC